MVWNGYWNGYWNWYWMIWNGYWNKLLIWILNSLKWILKWVRVKANLVPSPPLTSSLQRVCASTWQRWSLKIGKIPLKQHSYPDHYGSIFFCLKMWTCSCCPYGSCAVNPGLGSNCSRCLRRPKPVGNSHGKWPPWSRVQTDRRTEFWKTRVREKKLLSKYFSIIRIAEISTPFLHHHTLSTPCWLRRACSPWLYWHWDIV